MRLRNLGSDFRGLGQRVAKSVETRPLFFNELAAFVISCSGA